MNVSSIYICLFVTVAILDVLEIGFTDKIFFFKCKV